MAKEIYIPDVLSIKELAEKLDMKPSQIVSWLFMEGHMATLNSKIGFETAKKIECRCDVSFKRESIKKCCLRVNDECGHTATCKMCSALGEK